MPRFSLVEAQEKFDELIDLALAGEEVLIADGDAVVTLLPILETSETPVDS